MTQRERNDHNKSHHRESSEQSHVAQPSEAVTECLSEWTKEEEGSGYRWRMEDRHNEERLDTDRWAVKAKHKSRSRRLQHRTVYTG